ncbi:ribosomal protein S5-alanine N-acetyltransferase [Paraburkholderia sp. SEWSISQ10-3 4]|uniref:ribosomal protein S5-alanine N-acetyltransferase n=1 Tax=Paraburkholderia TaxID=1822464 RepID=UPI00224DCBD1|nr:MULTISPECIES: ribosomal protein S5-alanine N-acetyltransferase [Paraburkholderia]MCX4136871.1 ribosomal protein S5-alanine N-acetyltransferase [Paraburkholderia aspalathi]MDN7169563.1 ribosomal protein S5-alanine N-acetyltransferase [Paraburkholderia sp. SEWSISQ10-3 4]MDQ6499202.1 ribosomal protein S5-alanine N-acetyltransferase [Paraburkholderia aspalathi]
MENAANHPDEGLTTERVILRAVSENDASALQAHYAANRKHLQPWEPARQESFFNLDAIADRLRAMAHQTATGNALHLALFEREGDQLIGECNFTNIVRGSFQACHLGFSLAKVVEGKGLMRESLTVAIQHVFRDIGLHRIMANYRPENTRSAHLLASLGFEKEGLARSYLKINGCWADHVLTSLLNPDDLADPASNSRKL